MICTVQPVGCPIRNQDTPLRDALLPALPRCQNRPAWARAWKPARPSLPATQRALRGLVSPPSSPREPLIIRDDIWLKPCRFH